MGQQILGSSTGRVVTGLDTVAGVSHIA